MTKSTVVDRKAAWVLVPLFAGVGAITSCERIAYYSTGRNDPPPSTSTSSGTSSSGGPSLTRGALLQSVAACQLDLLASFRKAAEEFDTAAIAAKNDPTAREAARLAWTKAIDVWQQAELFQFGPAAPSNTPGGQSLRDQIYSWPLVSRCLVEQNIVSKSYENPDFGTAVLVNMRGLAAAEYLLYYGGSDNACSPSTNINASGDWAALGTDELALRKAHYASAIATSVANSARALEQAWRADGGNFIGKFLGAGSSGSVYTTEQMALNAVSDAMFYMEKPLKDLKLARPLGIMDCDAASCPEAVESRYAGRSRTHIRNNLVGFRMLLSGCDAGGNIGFDDLLTASGAGSLATKLTTNVDLAIAAADAVPQDDLAVALANDPSSVLALHAAVKSITDLLKTEFVSILDLEPPQHVEGDND
ncbi:MAG: imelysin family protein [Polyangiaceae bacterium]|nr:imelysin family protein [Polyangiaceae bacterium]